MKITVPGSKFGFGVTASPAREFGFRVDKTGALFAPNFAASFRFWLLPPIRPPPCQCELEGGVHPGSVNLRHL